MFHVHRHNRSVPLLLATSILMANCYYYCIFTTGAFMLAPSGPTRAGPIITSTWRRKPPVLVFQATEEARLSSEDILARYQEQLRRLREKDRASRALAVEELAIVYEDEHILVADKPAGVLCVPTEPGVPSLAHTVFEYFQQQQQQQQQQTGATGHHPDSAIAPEDLVQRMDQMVVHRLGIDTSGLLVFAKTLDGVRGMNALFRTRKVRRQYEALVCGHVSSSKDEGIVSLPLMRDYEHPPYMRVSTDQHQRRLLDLDPDIVGRKLLEAPKASLTHYQVISRELLLNREDLPVTRLTLTSISGRTHQLNVHCAAMGHPIVQDLVYGYQGVAAPNGGLDESHLPDNRAPLDLQQRIREAAADMSMCIHAKLIQFRHPLSKKRVECTSPAPF